MKGLPAKYTDAPLATPTDRQRPRPLVIRRRCSSYVTITNDYATVMRSQIVVKWCACVAKRTGRGRVLFKYVGVAGLIWGRVVYSPAG